MSVNNSILPLQENEEVSAFQHASVKRPAPWTTAAPGSAHKAGKTIALQPKAPLQPSQLNVPVASGHDQKAQLMGPPPPRKAPTQEQIVQAQVRPLP